MPEEFRCPVYDIERGRCDERYKAPVDRKIVRKIAWCPQHGFQDFEPVDELAETPEGLS